MTNPSGVETIPALSLQHNILFATIGRGYYGLTQILIIVVTARLGTLEDLGALTLATAIVTPLFFLTTMGMKEVLTVDDLDRFRRGDYVALRILGGLVAMALSLGTVLYAYGDGGTLVLYSVIGLSMVRFSGAQASLNHAMFQRAERLDYMAASIFVRTTAGFGAFTFAFWMTRDLPIALLCEAVFWFASYWILDSRLLTRLGMQTPLSVLKESSLRRIGSLALWVLPVGISLLLLRAASSVMPVLLERRDGLATVGIFGALFSAHTMLSMVANAVASAAVSRLRRHAREGKYVKFRKLLQKLVLMMLLIGVVATTLSWLIGAQVAALLFGPEYANRAILTIIVAGSALSQISSPLVTAITAAQAFGWRLFITVCTFVAALVAGLALVPVLGLQGAALAFVASSLASLLATLVATVAIFRRMRDRI